MLHKFLHRSSVSFEIDPVRAGGEAQALRNACNLTEAANHVLAAILSSADTMPMYESEHRTCNVTTVDVQPSSAAFSLRSSA